MGLFLFLFLYLNYGTAFKASSMKTQPAPVASSVQPVVPISQHSVSATPVRNVVTTEFGAIAVVEPSRSNSKEPGPQEAGLLTTPKVASELFKLPFFSNIKATTPATAGAEKLVPLMNKY